MNTLQLAERVGRIKPSPTLAVTARAKALQAAGKDIVGLGAGEPDFDTPEHIKAAAIEAINQGMTRYTPVGGTPSLKKAIIEKFKRDNGLDYELNQIIVSVGGKQSFYNMAQALLQTGDEVIVPAPYWVSYPDMVLLADATPVIVEADIEQKFKMTPAQLSAAITKKTKLVVLNSPSNPTGAVYTRDELVALGRVLESHPQVLVATDDMYEHIRWGGAPFVNIAMACPQLKDRCIVLNGVSKVYAMTGWRIGYAAAPAALVKAMENIQSQSTSNPTSISQAAAAAALNGDQSCIKPMIKAFHERHDHVVARLNKLNGVNCLSAEGAFYLFPDMREAMTRLNAKDDVAFCEDLLENAGVALVPGSAFGAPGYTRLSFATSMAQLDKALDRLVQYFNQG